MVGVLTCILTLLICVVLSGTGASTYSNNPICEMQPGKYLKPEKLDEAETGQVQITCFNNGLYSVCPANPSLTEEIRQQYRQGYFIRMNQYYVSQGFLCDRKNYNS